MKWLQTTWIEEPALTAVNRYEPLFPDVVCEKCANKSGTVGSAGRPSGTMPLGKRERQAAALAHRVVDGSHRRPAG
jgi:hypothetical protein